MTRFSGTWRGTWGFASLAGALCWALCCGWAWGWRRKGWIKSDKKPALNPDLWEMLLGLVSQHELHYHWVKGHAANEKNNRCDQQAVREWQKFK